MPKRPVRRIKTENGKEGVVEKWNKSRLMKMGGRTETPDSWGQREHIEMWDTGLELEKRETFRSGSSKP